jgi:hypothetical protein
VKKGDLVRAKADVSIVVPKGSTGIIIDMPRRKVRAAGEWDERLRYVHWFSLGRPTWALMHRLEVISEER